MLEIGNLSVAFRMDGRFVKVTEGIDLSLGKGETLGIVGESGSGKSVTSLAVMGLLPRRDARVEAARFAFEGRDLLSLDPAGWRSLRGKDVSMVFQDPMTSLNPLMRCGEQIAETLRLHRGRGRGQARSESVDLLARMGISDPERAARSYPFELSGGMRQRVMIAIALSCRPKLLIADEPTTALDVTVQAQILRLIGELQKEYGMALILITHDLGIIRDMVENLLVMYAGRVVERGEAGRVLGTPSHPYTRELLKSIPSLESRSPRLAAIEGVVPKPTDAVPGCRFHPRCPMAEEACKRASPDMAGETAQASACFRRDELRTAEAGETVRG